MKILVTGAKGFAGRNLVENLKNIRDGKNETRPDVHVKDRGDTMNPSIGERMFQGGESLGLIL